MTRPPLPDLSALDDHPVYVISVAAELAGMHPQTLRSYDRAGLVSPGRAGRARRYSVRDVALLREVAKLSQEEGVGLAGIHRILELQKELAELKAQAQALAQELAATHAELTEYRSAAADELAAALHAERSSSRRDLVPVRTQPGTSVVVWRRRRN